jgi:hypothetical protein
MSNDHEHSDPAANGVQSRDDGLSRRAAESPSGYVPIVGSVVLDAFEELAHVKREAKKRAGHVPMPRITLESVKATIVDGRVVEHTLVFGFY